MLGLWNDKWNGRSADKFTVYDELYNEVICIMSNMKIANIKSTRICAFCRNWYDPANAAIVPKAPQAGFFEYDPSIRNKCMLTGLEQSSWASCGKFSCKF